MNQGTPCPCCGHTIDPESALSWNEASRILSGRGTSVMLSPMHGKIFSKLWKAWPSGRMVTRGEMTDYVYAEDPDGGPESTNVISVHIVKLKRLIAPFDISIKGRCGYLIYPVDTITRAPNRKVAA